jgi:hypothetical protein
MLLCVVVRGLHDGPENGTPILLDFGKRIVHQPCRKGRADCLNGHILRNLT